MDVMGLALPEFLLVLGMVMVVPAIGVYRIAIRAGYSSSAAIMWAVAFAFPLTQWIALLMLGLLDWPRDRAVVVE